MESDVSSSAGKVLNIQVVHRKKRENLKRTKQQSVLRICSKKNKYDLNGRMVKRSITRQCWIWLKEEAFSDPDISWDDFRARTGD